MMTPETDRQVTPSPPAGGGGPAGQRLQLTDDAEGVKRQLLPQQVHALLQGRFRSLEQETVTNRRRQQLKYLTKQVKQIQDGSGCFQFNSLFGQSVFSANTRLLFQVPPDLFSKLTSSACIILKISPNSESSPVPMTMP